MCLGCSLRQSSSSWAASSVNGQRTWFLIPVSQTRSVSRRYTPSPWMRYSGTFLARSQAPVILIR